MVAPSVTVHIPTAFRVHARQASWVRVSGASVLDAIDNLIGKYPGLRERIRGGNGLFRSSLIVSVNDEDIRFLDGPHTALNENDVISIIPAIAGGCAVP